MSADTRVTAGVGSGVARADTTVLTVPGNLLLLGEYAVLEPGGLGIAVAIEKRVELKVEAAEELTVVGVNGQGAVNWKSSDSGSPSLAGEVIRAAARELASRGYGDAPRLSLRIDSSALFGADGKKIGLGSSAAVAVGIAYSLLSRAGLDGARLVESTFRAALEGHRGFQGGRGSGYDVAASLYGGYGLFTGGTMPSVERLELDWMPAFSLARGPEPVDTAQAIRRYEEWKRLSPETAKGFVAASNEIVRGFAAAKDWNEASSRLREAAQLATRLGKSIGVPVRLDGPRDRIGDFEGRVAKALGAGDELVAVWHGAASPHEVSERVAIAKVGPSWNA